MTTYAADHASALADAMAAGAAITFTLDGQGAVNMATDAVTSAADGVCAGYAVGDKPNLTQYAALGLTIATAKTLFFVPNTYGTLPALSSRGVWGGVKYAVKNVAPVEPDGVAIAASIVVAL